MHASDGHPKHGDPILMSQTTVQSRASIRGQKTRAKPRGTAKPKANGKAKSSALSRSKSNGKSNGNGKANGNGNGHARLTMADLKVAHAELVKENGGQRKELERLWEATQEMSAEFEKLHRYLDALHAPTGMPPSARAIEAVKIWFRKRGGVESSDHVSTTLRDMLRTAGEWRACYPDFYKTPDPTPDPTAEP